MTNIDCNTIIPTNESEVNINVVLDVSVLLEIVGNAVSTSCDVVGDAVKVPLITASDGAMVGDLFEDAAKISFVSPSTGK